MKALLIEIPAMYNKPYMYVYLYLSKNFEIHLFYRSFLMEVEEGFGVLSANSNLSTGLIGRLHRAVRFSLQNILYRLSRLNLSTIKKN